MKFPDRVTPSELPTKSNREILAATIAAGLAELRRPSVGLFVAALAAGLEVGFGPLLMATLLTVAPNASVTTGGRLLIGLLYSVGFIVVVVGRSELFTEHTSLVVFPVLNRDAGVMSLFRTWLVVLLANLVGTCLFAWLAVTIAIPLGTAAPHAFVAIGRGVVGHTAPVIFGSSILAGWLMGLVSWLVASARETISQIVLVALLTFAIGFVQLHHCVAGSVEVLAAWLVGGLRGADYLRFELPSIVGNAFGGLVFVALMRFGHATRAR